MKKPIIISILFVLIFSISYLFLEFPKNHNNVFYPNELTSINPANLTDYNNTRLIHVYESLVGLDKNLQIQPILVRSYGKLSPKKYEFSLKTNLFLHDGTKIDANHIVEFLKKLKKEKALSPHFDTIDNFKTISEYAFELNLKDIDPLILQKIAQIPIYDINKSNFGTGPYKIVKLKDQDLYLQRFDDYHGDLAKEESLNLLFEKSIEKRLANLNNKSTLSVLGLLPTESQNLPAQYNYESYSDLSSHFFLFNYNTNLGKDPNFQKLIKNLLQNIDFSVYTKNQVEDSNHFVPYGVFGYDSSVKEFEANEKVLTFPKYLTENKIYIDLNHDLKIFADYLKSYFSKAKLDVDFNFVNFESDFESQSPLIFIGFKSDYADSQSFFETVASSKGKYNLGNYQNQFIDSKLSELKTTDDQDLRLKLLQSMNRAISNKPYLGVPVFENKVYYAIKKGYNIEARLDGLLNFFQLTKSDV